MSVGVVLVLAMLRHLLADVLPRLGCPGIVARLFAGPGATAFDPEPPLKITTRKLPLICCLLAYSTKRSVGNPDLCLLASYSLLS